MTQAFFDAPHVDPFEFAADLFDPPGGRRYSEYCPHWPHPPQRVFLKLDEKVDREENGKLIMSEALYGGAAGPGKTDALLMSAIVGPDPDHPYVDTPGYSAIIFRRLSPDLHGADGLVERSKEWLTGKADWNGDRLRWTFPSGATVRFGHMQYEDDRHKFQGHAYQFVGWDELTHFTLRQYLYMFSRCRKPDGLSEKDALSRIPLRVRAASNPGGVGHEWVKKRLVDKIADPERDPVDTQERADARVFIPARLKDNPSVDQESYISALENLDPEERAQLLDGDWDARMPGDWYFEDLNGAIAYGRVYDELLAKGEMPPPDQGVLHLGIDWGESTHAVLGWPLKNGGWYITGEFVGDGLEPGESAEGILGLKDDVDPDHVFEWGRAFFDAAGVQSQKTFNRVAEQLLGWARPTAKSIPFGALAARTARSAIRSIKGVGAAYLRRLARRSNKKLPEQVLAISERCPELLRQMKLLPKAPEDPAGAWLKDDDQHGPDALVALVAQSANKNRELLEKELERAAHQAKQDAGRVQMGGEPEGHESEVVY